VRPQTLWRMPIALAIGMAVPHVTDALWRWILSQGVLSDGWAQVSSWAFVCVAAAWLVTAVASRAVLVCASAAAAGAVIALLAPFVVYGLPFGANEARLLALHFGVLGLAWPALIVLLALRRAHSAGSWKAALGSGQRARRCRPAHRGRHRRGSGPADE
jgi:hypothetical protein